MKNIEIEIDMCMCYIVKMFPRFFLSALERRLLFRCLCSSFTISCFSCPILSLSLIDFVAQHYIVFCLVFACFLSLFAVSGLLCYHGHDVFLSEVSECVGEREKKNWKYGHDIERQWMGKKNSINIAEVSTTNECVYGCVCLRRP